MQRPLRVSLVIPAYNEESHIAACLNAIATQTVRPFEVIVVDNNSTDATAAIAASYGFVRIIREPKQGVVFARDTGFDAARGDIIGRIDVDTLLPVDWIATVQRLFVESPELDAVSGTVGYYDFPFKRAANFCDVLARSYLAHFLNRAVYLYGSNMAMRREAWKSVRTQVCHHAEWHEDIDLAAHLAQMDRCRVAFSQDLKAQVSSRNVDMSFRTFYHYVAVNPRNYATHGLKPYRYMYVVIVVLLALHAPLRLIHRGYDARSRRFSLRRALDFSRPAHLSPLTEPPLF
ncbi:MAG TPA: glycosyltransferase family A protein [Candidatus Saccharimonadales bacterium]